jgi:octaprenyl-diphosphate synthase
MPAVTPTPMEPAAVQAAVLAALTRVEARFDEHLRSELPPVEKLVRHIESYRGKMLRPALVVLSGMAAGASETSDAHVTIAAVCEMIHMATLVHDDVLDEADTRRKGTTVNRLRGNETAVILGDYLFSSAYHLCSTLDSQQAALLIGACGMTLCTGELLQLHHRDNFSIDEPTYFEIVRRKTGSLISVACRLGALQSAAGGVWADRFADFGLKLGVAFQIQDDLLDLTGVEAVVGKPLRRDLALGKLTLPVIHHLAHATAVQRGRTLLALEDHRPVDAARSSALVAALEGTGSMAYARGKAEGLVDDAKAALAELPGSGAKDLLLTMADQVVTRNA